MNEKTKRVLELDKAATRGPWAVHEVHEDDGEDGPCSRGVEAAGRGLNRGDEYELFDAEDAQLIAEYRTLAPELARGVERLESERDEQRRRADALESERNAARAIARVLAHAYSTDNAPPHRMVDAALGFAVDQRAEQAEAVELVELRAKVAELEVQLEVAGVMRVDAVYLKTELSKALHITPGKLGLTEFVHAACLRIDGLEIQLTSAQIRLREESRLRPMSDAPLDGRTILAETRCGEWADWKWLETEWTRGEPGRQQYINMAGLKHWVPCPGDGEG